MREGQGLAFATIDMEVGAAGAMIRKTWDNDKVDGRIVKAFRKVKNRLKPGSNARDRILTIRRVSKAKRTRSAPS